MKNIFTLLIVLTILLTGCNNNISGESLPEVTDIYDNQSSDIETIMDDTNNIDDMDEFVQLSDSDVFEIREKMFIAQTNEIYYNAKDYLGKIIKYNGVFNVYGDSEAGQVFYSVIRYGPGCCGDDGNVGFEVMWDSEYPNHNDWVEAIGILEEYEEGGNKYLRLSLTSLTVLPTRGEEYVIQ
jgi:Predicted membrane protein